MKNIANSLALRPWALGVAFLWMVSPSQNAGAQVFGSDPEGVKQTNRLIDRAEDVVKQTTSARQEIGKTLDSYNALFGDNVTDLLSAYKDVEKGIERCDKQKVEVQKSIDTMSAEADTYFAGWTGSLENIQSQDLRKRSEDRMKETRGRFDGILAAARDAQKSYDPLISNLKDQWTYLGHDLNPSGIASLKPDADKLNQSATVLFKKIDDGMKTANDYITSLRSQKPATDD